MRMRNLNPYAGLRQIVSGYFCIPRRPILEWVRSKKMDAGHLGSFLIFLISADWDKDPHRQGFIRFSDIDLSNAWGIPVSTLRRWREQLVSIGLMEKVNDCYRIVNVDLFTFSGAREVSGKVTNEQIRRLFPDVIKDYSVLKTEYSKMEESEDKTTSPFDSSFKKSFEGTFRSEEITRNDDSFDAGIARRKDKIERRTTSGSLTAEDKDWINKNVTDPSESTTSTTTDDRLERDVKETLF